MPVIFSTLPSTSTEPTGPWPDDTTVMFRGCLRPFCGNPCFWPKYRVYVHPFRSISTLLYTEQRQGQEMQKAP